MSEIYNNINKVFYLDLDVIPITYCTDELKYIDQDSHFIHIPVEAYHNFLNLKVLYGKSEMPLYVGVRNNNQRLKRLCFGKVEPSIITPNSNHKSMLLPEWALKLLDIDFGDKLDLIYVVQPQSIAYIKVKANISSYIKYKNVKIILESKLSQYNCLNVGEKFTINEGESEDSVIFTVIELKDKKDNIIEYGAIYDVEVNIDFEIPEDIEKEKKEEKERKLIPRVLQKGTIEKKQISIINKNISNSFGSRIHTIKDDPDEKIEDKFKAFDGPGLKIGLSTKKLTKEEIRNLRIKKIEN